jgi:ATP-dependent helicase Lhr and Lhr-like helicase
VGGFERLTPALQYQIVNDLGWQELRPVQEQTIDVVLDGGNCVVLAPTAGGKTEAAILPLLSLADAEDRAAVSVLYIAPLRALLNNLEPRLQHLSGLVGRRAFKWHGDVGQRARRRFIEEPADILAITPESLEAMLIGGSVPRARVLGHLRSVVVDEVHSFAAGDRGGHLVALLERISRVAGRDLQRIGLSATVGNPEVICSWLAGSSTREQVVVNPERGNVDAALSLDEVGTLENAAVVIERLHPGRKRLIFADSRRRVEALGHELGRRGVEVHVTHSSLSVAQRTAAERAFEEGQSCVIVATSALELGIDIGDLDHVLQIDAPCSVSSFLQRMGRTGRRRQMPTNCTFLTTDDDSLVQAAALLRLYKQGYVEPVEPVKRGSHLLAHQLMALGLQHRGVPTNEWWSWVEGAATFTDLTADDRTELVEQMLRANILVEADGRLILGEHGEKLYGGRNFMDLYAVFSTPSALKVIWGPREIGTIDTYFARFKEASELTFVLAGRTWQATHVDWRRATCHVEPALDGVLPSWMGSPRLLARELCQAMREVLVDDEEDPWWSRRAREAMVGVRQEYAFLRDEHTPFTSETGRIRWWTFAGGKANNVLARLLAFQLRGGVSSNNICLTFTGGLSRSVAAVRRATRALFSDGGPDRATILRLAEGCARGRISKFQPCLSKRLELELLAESLMDVEGAEATVRMMEGAGLAVYALASSLSSMSPDSE